MTEETKKCPKCKEDIAKDAKKCKHCGADLRNWFVRHKIITGILALLVLGSIVAAIGGSGSTTTNSNNSGSTTKTEEAKTAIAVDATAFIGEFDKNQLSAEQKYKDKLVQFSAIIENISEDITSTPFLSLKPSADKYYVGTTIKCSFKSKDALTSLSNGQTVTLQGTVSNQSLGIIDVQNCSVIK